MKRKHRQHLPKAGTKTDEDWVRHEGTAHLEHPFSDDPTAEHGALARLVAIVMVAVILLALLGWLIIT